MQKPMFAAAVLATVAMTFASREPMTAQSDCLHGPGENPAQRARRGVALRLLRAINTAEVNGPFRSGGQFQPLATLQVDMASAAGFEPQLTTDGKSYAVIFRDTLDPCGFMFSTNQVGVIFQGYPIDFDVQPVRR